MIRNKAQALQKPDSSMTPEAKGELLLEYVAARQSIAGLDFRRVRAKRTNFQNANLAGANLEDADFAKSDFRGANLDEANLAFAYLSDANLAGASLVNADLGRARMSNTCLLNASLETTNLKGTRVELKTYTRSGWTPNELVALRKRGLEIVDLHEFPQEVRLAILGPSEGLYIYFNKELTPIDHVIISGIIAVSCEKGKKCKLAHFEENDTSAIAILVADDSRTLEAVATALFERAWQEGARQRSNSASLASSLNGMLSSRVVQEYLPAFLAALEHARLLRGHAGLEPGAPLVINYHNSTYSTTIIDSNVGAIAIGSGQAHGSVVYKDDPTAPDRNTGDKDG